MTQISPRSPVIPGAEIVGQMQSTQARLADLQALVNSIIAELQTLEPPQRPTRPPSGSPDHLRVIYEQQQAAFRRALRAFNGKVAHLNSRLQLAFRAMAELEHRMAELGQRLRRLGERQAAQQAEAAERQLESMRRAVEQAARRSVERQRQTDRGPGTPELSLVRTTVGGHLDSDGRADLRGESFLLIPHVAGDLHRSLRDQVDVLRRAVPTLEVLPAGETLDAEAVVELEQQFAPKLGEQHVDLLRSMLLNEALPNQRAEADVWSRTATAMHMGQRELVELVLGQPEPAELDTYAADYTAFVEQNSGRTPNAQQSEELAWRLAAGHRLGDASFFLQPMQIAPPRDERDEVRYIREHRELAAGAWDGPLTRQASEALLAAVRDPQSAARTGDAALDVFPVGGGLYNIGYDGNWDTFDQANAFHSSDFGPGDAKHRASGRGHPANDIFAPLGAPLVAPFDGTVAGVGYSDVGGNYILIRQGNTDVYYAHMDEHVGDLRVGDELTAGQPVGTLGNTGSARGTAPHLHISVKVDGSHVDPFPHLMAARERRLFSPVEVSAETLS